MITAICRRLDGIPLAIELAAARAAALGVEELSARLDDRFRLLTGGRRTALPRHQTLRATLDWSYELLTEPERMVLRRLAIFAGTFSLEAAGAVAASPGVALSDVVDGVSSWSRNRSLRRRWTAPSRATSCSTRRGPMRSKSSPKAANASCSRAATPNIIGISSNGPKANGRRGPRPSGWRDYGRQIDNLRAALDWAFSPAGDASIGLALTTAAVPLVGAFVAHGGMPQPGRTGSRRYPWRSGSRPSLRDEAPRRAWRIANTYWRCHRSSDGCGLDKGPRDCGETSGCRVPVALAAGPMVLSNRQRSAWRRSGIGAKLL